MMNEITSSSLSSSFIESNINKRRAEQILHLTLQTKSDILFLKHKKKLLLEEMYRQYIEGEIEPRKRIRRITKLEEDLGNEFDPTKDNKINEIDLKEKNIIATTSQNITEINTMNNDLNKEDISNENSINNIIKKERKGKKTDAEKEADKESLKQLKEAKELEKQTIKIAKDAAKEATKLSKEIKKKTIKDSIVIYQSDITIETELKD